MDEEPDWESEPAEPADAWTVLRTGLGYQIWVNDHMHGNYKSREEAEKWAEHLRETLRHFCPDRPLLVQITANHILHAWRNVQGDWLEEPLCPGGRDLPKA